MRTAKQSDDAESPMHFLHCGNSNLDEAS